MIYFKMSGGGPLFPKEISADGLQAPIFQVKRCSGLLLVQWSGKGANIILYPFPFTPACELFVALLSWMRLRADGSDIL